MRPKGMKRWIRVAALVAMVVPMYPAPTGARPMLPKGRIVFESSRDGSPESSGLSTVRPDGTQLTRLTDQDDFTPQWAPGHDWIAFQRAVQTPGPTGPITSVDIYTMRSDGSRQTEIAPNASAATWSPDGTRLAYSYGGDIWTAAPDGSDKQQVTQAMTGGYDLTWSPDGTKIAFARTWDIYVVEATGGEAKPLITSPEEEEYYPTWSPDGTTIAYASTYGHYDGGEGAYSNDIWVMGADGSDPRQITANCHWNSWLSWTPDSRRIVYMAGDDDDGCAQPRDPEIRVVGVNEGTVANGKNLTSNKSDDAFPALSPDGRWVVYKHYGRKRSSDSDLRIMRLDGRGLRKAVGARPDSDEGVPDW